MSDARRFRSGSMENRRLTLSLGLTRFLLDACSTLDAPPQACLTLAHALVVARRLTLSLRSLLDV